MSVIHIKFSTDLAEGQPKELGRLLNKMRHRMELGHWRAKYRAAKALGDNETLDRLNREYERVGLP